ncbi:unnamed protein product, partial [Phaeothamnion confervicola]
LGTAIIFVAVSANIYLVPLAPENPIKYIGTGLFLYLFGAVFIAAYYAEEHSFIFRWAMRICTEYSSPASRKMAFFYFGLGLFAGSGAIYEGISKLN